MSVDVSKDARSVVFDLLGDVYRLDLTGGKARPLIVGDSFDTQPVLSPDGRRIAFISDRTGAENLWIVDAEGGNARRLSNETESVLVSPAWSADGQHIYVTRFNSRDRLSNDVRGELWVYHRQGGGEPVTGEVESRAKQLLGAAPSPDGRYLHFAANMVGERFDIYRRDLATGKSIILLSGVAYGTGVFQPGISPDGRKLVYGVDRRGRTALRLRDLSTGEDKLLAFPVETSLSSQFPAFQGLLPRYAFTPDARSIVLGHGGKLRRIELDSGSAIEIPFTADVRLSVASSERTVPSEDTGSIQARMIQGAQLSPNAKRLAMTAFGKLYAMRMDDPTPRRLTSTPLSSNAISENQPAWSPDGHWLAYVSWSRQGGGHIWRIRSDGKGRPQRLTQNAAYYRRPIFTPDGNHILALRSSMHDQADLLVLPMLQSAQELIRIPASGGPVEVIAQLPAGADPGRLHFSADTGFVLVHTSAGLLRVPMAGGDPQPLLKVVSSEASAEKLTVDDVRLSPDGRWALALKNFQLHLLALAPLAGDSHMDLDSPPLFHRQLTEIGADEFFWSADGRVIGWTVGTTLYQVPLQEILDDSASVQGEYGCAEQRFSSRRIQVELPRQKSESRVLLRGARVVTMRGKEIMDNADLLVVGDRIAVIGTRGEVDVPTETTVHNVKGKTITPGFVDTHAHYWFLGKRIIDYDSWEYRAALAYGVTASIDPQSFTTDAFVYRDLIDAGAMLGPRAYTTGPGIFGWNRIGSTRQARCVLRRYRDHYRTSIVKSYMVGSRAQRQHMARAAGELKMMLIAENWGVPRYALTHAIDGFATNEHASDAVDYYADVAQLYSRLGTGYSPTTLVGGAAGLPGRNYFLARSDWYNDEKLRRFVPGIVIDNRLRRVTWMPGEQYIFARLAASAAKIFHAGGTIGVGGHGELQGLGYHWEMQALAAGGLDAHEVLQIATRSSATVVGRQAEIGTIEPGKYADLLIFDRDPLVDLANINTLVQVMKGGRLYQESDL